MADLFAKLKFQVDGTQALENAKKGILESGQSIKQMGKTFNEVFDDIKRGNLISEDAAKNFQALASTIGSLESNASSTKGQLRDYTQVLADLTVRYRELSDEDKNSVVGKAMAQSIQQLTEKAGNAKDAMDDVAASIKNAASDTRAFDQLSGAMSTMTSAFQVGQGAAKLLGIELGDNVEVLAKLQAAMAITNGLSSIQTALQKQSALMQGVLAARTALATAAQTALAAATGSATAAQAAFNLVAKANPYVLLASALAAVGTALYAFASASSKAKKEEEELEKQTEETREAMEQQQKSFFENSSAAAADASVIRSLQIQYANANTEIQKTAILEQAADKFKKLGYEVNGLNDAQTLLTKYGTTIVKILTLQGTAAAISAMRMEALKESIQNLLSNGYDLHGATILASANHEVREMDAELSRLQAEISGLQATLPKGSGGSGRGYGSHSGGGTTTTTNIKKEQEAALEGSLNYYNNQLSQKQKELREATVDTERAAIQFEIDKLKEHIKEIQSAAEYAAFKKRWENSGLKYESSSVDLSPKGFGKLDKIDTTFGMQLAKYMNSLPKEKKNFSLTDNKYFQGAEELYGGINDIKSGLEAWGIKFDSGFDDVLKKFDGAMTLISGIQTIITTIQAFFAPTQTALLGTIAANTAIIATASTIDAFIPFARGGVVHAANGFSGVVPGTSWANDKVPALLNSGEVVLNRAQTNNLASQLSTPSGALSSSPYVSGEQIFLGLNNYLRRSGRGEIITSR